MASFSSIFFTKITIINKYIKVKITINENDPIKSPKLLINKAIPV